MKNRKQEIESKIKETKSPVEKIELNPFCALGKNN